MPDIVRKKSRNLQIFIAIALCSEFAYIGIASLADLRTSIIPFLLFFGIAFLLYWIASFYFFDFDNSKIFDANKYRLIPYKYRKSFSWLGDFASKFHFEQKLSWRETLIIGIVFGILFRITLLITVPSLSDDIYRYIWDGKVTTQDINPYLYAPNAEELTALRDNTIYPNINHKEIPTVYPPVAQITFLGIYQINASVMAFKIAFVIFELLTTVTLFFILKHLSLSYKKLLLYIWNPLVIIEFAGSGHADIIGIMFLTMFFYFVIRNRVIWANLALILSFLVKFISIVFLPVIFLIKREHKLILPIMFIMFVAFSYLPYAEIGTDLFTGLTTYTSTWEFNSSLFSLIKTEIGDGFLKNVIVKYILAPKGSATIPDTVWAQGHLITVKVAKGICIFAFFILIIYYLRRLKADLARGNNIWFFKLGLIFLGAYILLSPTVHPWYLCWIVPFLVVIPNRAWLLLTGSVVLSYWVLIGYAETGLWQESNWIKYAEYLPFYALLIFDFFKNKAKNNKTAARTLNPEKPEI